MVDGIQYRIGFKSKNQLPFFMVWKEEWNSGKLVFAWVIFNSRQSWGF